MFKKVFIVRHGAYDKHTERLNGEGRMQIMKISEILKRECLEEKNVLMVSSSAERATDSAEILSTKLAIPYTAHEHFWSENRHPINNQRAYDLLKIMNEEKKAEILIFVTNLEYAEGFGEFLIKKAEKNFRGWFDVNKGEMLEFDFVANTSKKVA